MHALPAQEVQSKDHIMEPLIRRGTRHNRSVGGWRLGPYIRFETLSLRHQPVANGSQLRFCREKTRGICSSLKPTSTPCNVASSQNRSLERLSLPKTLSGNQSGLYPVQIPCSGA